MNTRKESAYSTELLCVFIKSIMKKGIPTVSEIRKTKIKILEKLIKKTLERKQKKAKVGKVRVIDPWRVIREKFIVISMTFFLSHALFLFSFQFK